MVNPSVQKVCIVCAVLNLTEQYLLLGEIWIFSANLRRFLLCSTCFISFLSMAADWFSCWTSCATHMSVVHVRFPLATFLQGWWLDKSGVLNRVLLTPSQESRSTPDSFMQYLFTSFLIGEVPWVVHFSLGISKPIWRSYEFLV